MNGRAPNSTATRDIVRFAARNRWLVFGVPLATLLLTAFFVARATPVYQGVATARIDSDRSNIALLDALQELSSGASIYTEMAELKSRSLAENIVDSLDLNVVVEEPKRIPRSDLFSHLSVTRLADSADYTLTRTEAGGYRLTSGQRSENVRIGVPFRINGGSATLASRAAEHDEIRLRVLPFNAAVRNTQRAMKVIRPDREADVVEVKFETTDRVLARDVPNAAAQLFIGRRQSVKSSQARSTVDFLDEQLDTLGQQLRAYEQGLQQFREGESVVSIEAQGEAQVSRLAEFQANRDIADAERTSLAKLMNEVESAPAAARNAPSPYRRLIGFPTILNNPAASEVLRSLNEIENQRAELLTKRTTEDPDVIILTNRIGEMETQLHQLVSTYLAGLNNRIASLDRVLGQFATDLRKIPAQEIQLARLKRQAKATEDIFITLQQRKKEAQIVAAVQDPSVRVIDPAIVPFKPISPNKPLSFVLALILGIALGGAIAFMRENLDTTIHTREELQTESGAVPVLGMIPRIREPVAHTNGKRHLHVPWLTRTPTIATSPEAIRSRLVAGRNPRGSASEAYRTLRTNLTFAHMEKPPRTLVFTSPAPGDGKSTSSSNLAITLAQQGLRSIIIDADMRRGMMHNAFDTTNKPGLSDYLLGGLSLEDVIRSVDLADAPFDFIPTGTLPPNPAELLASTRMQALLEHLEGQYDAVIFDAPPLNVVTDAAVIGARTDGVILVVRAGVTDRAAVRYAFDQLARVHAKVLGCVLNDVDSKRDNYYGTELAGKYYEAHS
jgi:capsular exopolysaccharide synthesis family protein